jgi:hypothetical protein
VSIRSLLCGKRLLTLSSKGAPLLKQVGGRTSGQYSDPSFLLQSALLL